MIERTLLLVKPDGVERGLVGAVLSRFERAGLTLVACRLMRPTRELAGRHYTWEDIGVRHGAAVRDALLDYLTSGPVLAVVLEGDHAVEVVRKLCGATEPRVSAPGTIRGDLCHGSLEAANAAGVAAANLVHASANEEDAAREIPLWFTPRDLES